VVCTIWYVLFSFLFCRANTTILLISWEQKGKKKLPCSLGALL